MKLLLRILIVLVLIIAGLVLYVQMTWDKTYSAPYPDIKASTDSLVIERGKYLVYGPSHCSDCHFSLDRMEDARRGLPTPLVGGLEFVFPPATIRTANITPDLATGIGKLTDSEIARTLRYSVGHDGRYILPPFMAFQEMSDEDLTAIVSYIRTLEPVNHEVKPSEYSFLGKALLAFNVLPVRDTTIAGPKKVVKDTTAEYGAYMASGVCNCLTCHTKIDMFTLEHLAPEFSGGLYFEPDNTTEGYGFVSPNLTSDPETGVIADWDVDTFISRFKAGRIHNGSPMPWSSFKNMDETELKAIYKFLKSLKPVKNKVAKTVYAPGEEYKEN